LEKFDFVFLHFDSFLDPLFDKLFSPSMLLFLFEQFSFIAFKKVSEFHFVLGLN